ncbi:MAG: molybdenum cofactor guanylyltransferase [Gemmatimonadetes bacterium]|nr:molybdenum cofactor guanylyltransferase [Gemmatimonadota bacterium]MDA1102795.1 molybdenum cofactor guanylyltransferase [Gemmatimonadota bacterium]
MTARLELLGAVLAGGASRRLGRDKAAEYVGNVRLVERAVLALSSACDPVVVVSSRPDTPTGPWMSIPDLRAGCGPLAGIEAALEHALALGREGVFVLACDLPLVEGGVVERIVAASRNARVCVPSRQGDPDFEPLAGVYSVACLADVRRLLDEGVRSARRLFEEAGGVRVSVSDEAFLNVNTESDLARAEARLGTSGP